MATVKKDAIVDGIKQAYAKGVKACPTATVDIHINLKNRNNAIKEYGYGPLNPEAESRVFWQKKADMWDTTVREAKKARCGNCGAFIQTPQMLKCMAEGLHDEPEEHEGYADEVIEAANLGYCELFHFKCAGDRTCDAWLVGGPIR
jgi:hypothetical protein